LLELFRRRCQSISHSDALAKFAGTITNIGIAHSFNLNWIGEQIQDLLSSFKVASRKWVIAICPDPFNQRGVLPAWFKDGSDVIYDADLYIQLSAKDTENALTEIEAEIAPHFEEAVNAVLDIASVQIAQAVAIGPRIVNNQRARQDPIAAIIATVKRDNPDRSIEQICQFLDARGYPVREIDRANFSKWHEAWKDPTNRNRIKRYISGIRSAAPKRTIY